MRVVHTVLLLSVCANLWIALTYLMFVRNAGAEPGFSRFSVATYLLLIAAPAATFIPIARSLDIPFYELEGIAGWATFGSVITFVSPEETISRAEFLVFLLPFTVALATVFTLIAYGFGRRIHGKLRHESVCFQARRQGYLVAISVVALILLHSFGVLSPFNGTLLIVIVVLTELLMQARFGMPRISRQR